MVATGKGATMSVLLKNAKAIKIIRKIDTIGVDKTGTFTLGKPKLTCVVAAGEMFEDKLLRLYLQLSWCAGLWRSAVSVVRYSAESDYCSCCHEPLFYFS